MNAMVGWRGYSDHRIKNVISRYDWCHYRNWGSDVYRTEPEEVDGDNIYGSNSEVDSEEEYERQMEICRNFIFLVSKTEFGDYEKDRLTLSTD